MLKICFSGIIQRFFFFFGSYVLGFFVVGADGTCDAILMPMPNHVTQLTVRLDRMCLPSSRPRDNFLFKIAQFIFFAVRCWQAIAMIAGGMGEHFNLITLFTLGVLSSFFVEFGIDYAHG